MVVSSDEARPSDWHPHNGSGERLCAAPLRECRWGSVSANSLGFSITVWPLVDVRLGHDSRGHVALVVSVRRWGRAVLHQPADSPVLPPNNPRRPIVWVFISCRSGFGRRSAGGRRGGGWRVGGGWGGGGGWWR